MKNLPLILDGKFHGKIADIAELSLEHKNDGFLFGLDGEDAVIIETELRSSQSLYHDSIEIIEVVNQLRKDTENHIELEVIYDPSEFISQEIKRLAISILVSILLTFCTIYFFFNNLKLTLISCIQIPLVLLSSFSFFGHMNIGLNIVTLSAISVAVGLLIDSVVVVVHSFSTSERSENRLDLSIKVVKENFRPIIASTLTTCSVFIPLSFTSPIASSLLGDIGKVITVVLSVSLIFSLIILPGLYACLTNTNQAVSLISGRLYTGLSGFYLRVIFFGSLSWRKYSTIKTICNGRAGT